jgi:3-oxoacyl-[acyl-carrier-protein] synthase-1
MEAKALFDCGLADVPLNSFKGYWGHTLGAAGIIESAMAVECLAKNSLLPSTGYEIPGVSVSVNVIKETSDKQLSVILKTASGFGGCNAAALFQKS